MRIYEVTDRSPDLLASLLTVWEASVRATHLFLTDAEIRRIREYVPQAMAAVQHLVVAEEANQPMGFMGAENGRLEMLFLSPDARGKGLGRQLMTDAMTRLNVTELTVNEQNPQAVGFYEHLGFAAYQRTDCDEEDNPYPLLYMRLTSA